MFEDSFFFKFELSIKYILGSLEIILLSNLNNYCKIFLLKAAVMSVSRNNSTLTVPHTDINSTNRKDFPYPGSVHDNC